MSPSATPATWNDGGCRQVPRLPRETTVDVAKCHACHVKQRPWRRRFAWQAWHLATSIFFLRGRHGTSGTGLAQCWLWWWRAWVCLVARGATALCVAGMALGDIRRRFGVALGDITLRFAWQAWHFWDWDGSGDALGSAWSSVAPQPGVALRDIDLRFARQAWHLVTSAVVFCVALGDINLSFCVAGVVLMGLGWLWWRAWVCLVARGTAALCVAGVALGDIRTCHAKPKIDVTKCHTCQVKQQVPRLPRESCDKSCMWQSCVWQSCMWQSCVWQNYVWQSCVCVCERLCVTKLCVCVWQSCVCVWLCDKDACERWCVTKFCVTICVRQSCVWQFVCDKVVCDKIVCDKVVCERRKRRRRRRRSSGDRDGGGADLKTRTPHNFVRKKRPTHTHNKHVGLRNTTNGGRWLHTCTATAPPLLWSHSVCNRQMLGQWHVDRGCRTVPKGPKGPVHHSRPRLCCHHFALKWVETLHLVFSPYVRVPRAKK